jgi:L-lactate dehydrogenase (cytochrome)
MPDAVRYSRIEYLAKRARRRVPFPVKEYLESGTGDEDAVPRNRRALNAIRMVPRFLKGPFQPDTSCRFLDVDYAAPIGTAPLGSQGLIWPGAEKILAHMAAKHRVAYSLGTGATQTPETIGPIAGEHGWFQFYKPSDDAIARDLLKRAADAGFRNLLVTIDVPVDSRRERMRSAGFRVPFRIGPRLLAAVLSKPAYTLAVLRHGTPRFRTMESYWGGKVSAFTMVKRAAQWAYGSPDWGYLDEVRQQWPGKVLLKGVLHPEDAAQALAVGLDGVVVSNHGGRLLDGAPAATDMLPEIVERVGGKMAVVFDSGLRGGLDIARALALGADFCLLGRAFMYGVAALGARGGDHTAELLIDDLKNVMAQLGCRSLRELRDVSIRYDPN